MNAGKPGIIGLVTRFAGRLKYPQLFFVTAALFLLNLFFPDPIPFLDEVLLGLGTLLLGRLRKGGKKEDRTVEDQRSGPD